MSILGWSCDEIWSRHTKNLIPPLWLAVADKSTCSTEVPEDGCSVLFSPALVCGTKCVDVIGWCVVFRINLILGDCLLLLPGLACWPGSSRNRRRRNCRGRMLIVLQRIGWNLHSKPIIIIAHNLLWGGEKGCTSMRRKGLVSRLQRMKLKFVREFVIFCFLYCVYVCSSQAATSVSLPQTRGKHFSSRLGPTIDLMGRLCRRYCVCSFCWNGEWPGGLEIYIFQKSWSSRVKWCSCVYVYIEASMGHCVCTHGTPFFFFFCNTVNNLLVYFVSQWCHFCFVDFVCLVSSYPYICSNHSTCGIRIHIIKKQLDKLSSQLHASQKYEHNRKEMIQFVSYLISHLHSYYCVYNYFLYM